MYLITLCLVCAFLGWWLWSRRAAAAEFATLFVANKEVEIQYIAFSGQHQTLVVNDPETLALIRDALRSARSEEPKLGMTYKAHFRFKSGRSFDTFIYIHDDKGGLTVADPTVTHAGDPMTISIRIQTPVHEKLGRLFDELSLRKSK